MATCITCGTELHPERAEKYDYCTAPDCQEKNVKGVTMVALGQNKAADQYLMLDEQARDDIASGRYHDQRRGSYGKPAPQIRGGGEDRTQPPARARNPAARAPARRVRRTPPTAKPTRRPWSRSQEKLALLYNEQGMRPDEIARRLGLSTYTVTQILLAGMRRRRR